MGASNSESGMSQPKAAARDKGRIAMIVYYGWLSVSPSITNSALVWSKNGYVVDIFYRHNERFPGWVPPKDSKINLWPIKSSNRSSTKLVKLLDLLAFMWRVFRFMKGRKYDSIIGIDPQGLVAASAVSLCLRRVPLIYHSLESLLIKNAVIKFAEKCAIRRALAIIALSEDIAEALSHQFHIDPNKFIVVPNAPISSGNKEKTNFIRNKFHISHQQKIALYSGSFIHEHSVEELIKVVPSWPSEWVLVLHGWGPKEQVPYLEGLAGDLLNKRIFISSEVLKFHEYRAFVASADIGIALYTPDNPLKWRYVQPGKIFQYLQCGVPVIASKSPSLMKIIESNACGICIESSQELPHAIEVIHRDYERYRANALRCFDKYEFSSRYQQVVNFLSRYTSTLELGGMR